MAIRDYSLNYCPGLVVEESVDWVALRRIFVQFQKKTLCDPVVGLGGQVRPPALCGRGVSGV